MKQRPGSRDPRDNVILPGEGPAFKGWSCPAEAWQIPEEKLARMPASTEDETMYEKVGEMRAKVHRDGIRKGLERGRAEGRRALAGCLVAKRFGAETAEQLSQVLEDISDPERLAEVFDAIIDCDSDAELVARVGM